jgi:hypothetical protein
LADYSARRKPMQMSLLRPQCWQARHARTLHEGLEAMQDRRSWAFIEWLWRRMALGTVEEGKRTQHVKKSCVCSVEKLSFLAVFGLIMGYEYP